MIHDASSLPGTSNATDAERVRTTAFQNLRLMEEKLRQVDLRSPGTPPPHVRLSTVIREAIDTVNRCSQLALDHFYQPVPLEADDEALALDLALIQCASILTESTLVQQLGALGVAKSLPPCTDADGLETIREQALSTLRELVETYRSQGLSAPQAA